VRKDDTPEVFKTRLDAYRKQTAPLSDYYAGTGLLRTIDGMKPVDGVTQDLVSILDRHTAPAES
jgi:adenylate kinase